jgi:hypothetical protein
MSYAPGVTRTHNLLIRSQMLYPIELRVRKTQKVALSQAKSRDWNRVARGGILLLNLTKITKSTFASLSLGKTFLGRKNLLCSLRSFVAIW